MGSNLNSDRIDSLAPALSACRLAHPCRSRPRGSIREQGNLTFGSRFPGAPFTDEPISESGEGVSVHRRRDLYLLRMARSVRRGAQEHALERAERWLREGLPAAGLNEKELAATPRSGSEEGRSGPALVAGHDGLASLAGGTPGDAECSKRQPAMAACGNETDQGKCVQAPALFLGASDGSRLSLSRFAH
jgi:hypothetical protein